MVQSIVDEVISRLKELEAEDRRVVIVDYEHSPNVWVTVTVFYKKGGEPDEYQATFSVHWVSNHIWHVDVSNGLGDWQVVIEADPFSAFYMAVGFTFVNLDD